MLTSPTDPRGSSLPAASRIVNCMPVGRPTESSLRSPGGSGLVAIWWEASVMPYACSTGVWKRASNASCVAGASADEHERTKRSGGTGPLSVSSAVLSRIVWIVGTAVYHEALCSRTSGQNPEAENLGGATTVPPATIVAKTLATRPCTWKSGITQSVVSPSRSAYEAATFRAEASRLSCVSGTPFGREVVPDV